MDELMGFGDGYVDDSERIGAEKIEKAVKPYHGYVIEIFRKELCLPPQFWKRISEEKLKSWGVKDVHLDALLQMIRENESTSS